MSEETRFQGRFQKSVLQAMWFAYGPYIFWLVLLIVFGILGRALLLANANIIGVWVDSFCQPGAAVACRTLPHFFSGWGSWEYIRLLLAMTTAGFLMTMIFRIGFSDISAMAVSRFYDETTYRTSRFPLSFFDSTPTGRVVTRFSSDYGNVFRLFGGPLAEFLSIIFDMICMAILIGVASPYYLPAIVLIAVLNFATYKFNQMRLRQARRELSASRSPSVAHFAETAQGASTIRTFLRGRSFSNRFQRLDNYYLNQRRKVVGNLLSFSIQMNFLTAILLALIGVMAYFFTQQGWLSVGSIGVAFSFIALSGNTVQNFFEWMSQFEEAMIGVERLNHYLRKDTEPGARLPAQAQFATEHWKYQTAEEKNLQNMRLTAAAAAEVNFDHVWFRYSPDLPYVLKDLNFTIKAGERFGIVGRTGSGKSSLIQALFYLYPIEKGEIRIDHQRPLLHPEMPGIDLELYRRSMAFIAQDPALFRGSLRENLDVSGQYSDSQLFEILRQVGLEEWATVQGLRMKIEEKGRNLSLGEKQLICMARCLLQNAPVVIMDEATSSVDPHSEEILVKATEQFFKDHTQIIIAHRLSTLQKCDRVLWLQDGMVHQIGTPAEILPLFEKSNLSLSLNDEVVKSPNAGQPRR